MSMFNGLSAFPLTPLDERGNVIPRLLEKHLNRIADAGPDSIGLLGSTGSYAYLSADERKRIVRLAVRIVEGRVPLIVGVGSLRTDEAVELARDAAEAGAQGLLLAPMSYQKLTDDEVYELCRAVSEATELPLCLYNNPGTTNFLFRPDLISRLAQLPNIHAVKMPIPADGDFAAELANLRSLIAGDFSIGYSGDWGGKPALLAGADCWYSVIAGLLPKASVQLARAAQSGDVETASRIDEAFESLWKLFKKFGSFRVMYVIADLLDGDGIEPMRPVLPLAAGERDNVLHALDTINAAVKAR